MPEPSFPSEWKILDGKASLEVRTRDFAQALELLNRVARIAEELDHHPDLHLEGYNTLRVETWSHDVRGLTQRDERLARAVHDALAEADVLSRPQS